MCRITSSEELLPISLANLTPTYLPIYPPISLMDWNSIQSYDLFGISAVFRRFFGLSVGEGWLCLELAFGYLLTNVSCMAAYSRYFDFCMSMSMMN